MPTSNPCCRAASSPGFLGLFCFNIPMRLTPAHQHTIKATAAVQNKPSTPLR